MVNVDIDKFVAADLASFKRILKIMEAKYTQPVTTPGMSMDDIMYRAGQYSVLTHFREVVARVEASSPVPSTVVN